MEFRVQLSATLPDADQLGALLVAEDPAATGELDGAAKLWRVNTALSARDLVGLLGRAGCPTPLAQVTVLPSVCCGGCSG
jgi:hypothetical protein